MIAIIGHTNDDIIYFKAKLSKVESFFIYEGIEAFKGNLGREEVILANAREDSIVSSLIVSQIISKFEPYIVFDIGTVTSFNSKLHQGDIFIAERFYPCNVDYTLMSGVQFGQLPFFGEFFTSDTILVQDAEQTSYLFSSRYVQRGYLLSGSTFLMEPNYIEPIINNHYLQEKENMIGYDNTGYGVALACALSKTSLLCVRGVSYTLGNQEQRLSFRRKGLEIMPDIGKIITHMVFDKEGM